MSEVQGTDGRILELTNFTSTTQRLATATVSRLSVPLALSQLLHLSNCAAISCPSATSPQARPVRLAKMARRTFVMSPTPYSSKKQVTIPWKFTRASCGPSSPDMARSSRSSKSRAPASGASSSGIKWVERVTSSVRSQNCTTFTLSTRLANTSVRLCVSCVAD